MDFLKNLLGFLPCEYGTTFGLVSSVNGIVNRLSISRVKNTDGYAEIVSIYSREFGTSASKTWI